MAVHGNVIPLQEGLQCVVIIKNLVKKLKLDESGTSLKIKTKRAYEKLLEIANRALDPNFDIMKNTRETKEKQEKAEFSPNFPENSEVKNSEISTEKRPQNLPENSVIPEVSSENEKSEILNEPKKVEKQDAKKRIKGCIIISRADLCEYLIEENNR